MAELSKEAMQLLELTPRWELRPEYRPAASISASPRESMVVVGLAASSAGQMLWTAISRAMIEMGYPRPIIESAVILSSPQVDRVVQVLLSKRPASLLVFGEAFLSEIESAHAAALQDCRVISVTPLEGLTQEPARKAQLWSVLHQLRVEMAFER
ncbi:hypothetical protein AOB54_05000 [beta proteobacterium MWH-UniP1]